MAKIERMVRSLSPGKRYVFLFDARLHSNERIKELRAHRWSRTTRYSARPGELRLGDKGLIISRHSSNTNDPIAHNQPVGDGLLRDAAFEPQPNTVASATGHMQRMSCSSFEWRGVRAEGVVRR